MVPKAEQPAGVRPQPRPADDGADASPARPSRPAAPPPSSSEAAEDLPRFEDLSVDGFEPAVVSWPEEPRTREPLVVATHGAGGGPKWQCRAWRAFVGERGVILCPAGRRMGGAYAGHYYPNHHVLGRIVAASLQALQARHGRRVDTRESVYAGYSQGATMGSHMITAHADTFTRLVLIEGGYAEWNVPRGMELKSQGGQRVLFACGTRRCDSKAKRSAEWLQQAGLETRVATDLRGGHTYGGAVGRLVQDAFMWVVRDDARWQ